MKKQVIYLLFALPLLFSCSNNDEVIVDPAPADVWGKTLKGEGQMIKIYPDIFANYWEYTFDHSANPNIGLIVKGNYPDARFFNFIVYDENTTGDVSNIEDVNLIPDEACQNPYVVEKDRNSVVYGTSVNIIVVLGCLPCLLT